MTGHQQNPTTGLNIRGEPAGKIDLEALCRSMGIRRAEIAEARYGTCSTIFTTQLQRHALGNIAKKESLALSSLKDRLFRPSDIYVTLSGSSLRGTAGEIRGERQ